MKIKDAELITGLSAKTIRFHESEGLISVRRNSNAYREYDEDNIKELKRIKILRQLEIPISKIKEFKSGNISLENILREKLEELNKGELDIQSKKLIMNTGKVEKTSSKENYELCDFDQRYVDRFLRIIDNK